MGRGRLPQDVVVLCLVIPGSSGARKAAAPGSDAILLHVTSHIGPTMSARSSWSNSSSLRLNRLVCRNCGELLDTQDSPAPLYADEALTANGLQEYGTVSPSIGR